MLQEFVQEVENTARSVLDEIHTALPGKIISFDDKKGVAVVQPSGKYVTTDGTKLEFPKISDVPLVLPFCQSSGIGMAFPIDKGDSCIIIVSEIELDEWRSGAESEALLRFDLTSAMAIPGLLYGNHALISKATKNKAVVLEAVNSELMVFGDGISIKTGDTKLLVSESGVSIGGDLKVSGNIITTKNIKAGNIDFKEHTHISSEPGTSNGEPE